jgi:ABC-type amino acid transport substrate-binding protein
VIPAWAQIGLQESLCCVSMSMHALSCSMPRLHTYTYANHPITVEWLQLQVMCDGMDNPADYSGFQVALWREIAADLGWSDSDWSFSCVDWTAMIEDLVDPDGVCSFAAAGEHQW